MSRSNGFGLVTANLDVYFRCTAPNRGDKRWILPKREGRLPERPFDVAMRMSFVMNGETIRWRVDTEWNGCRGTKIQNARLNNRGVRCFLPAVSRVYRRHTSGYARVYDVESNIFSADRFLSPRSRIYHVQIMYALYTHTTYARAHVPSLRACFIGPGPTRRRRRAYSCTRAYHRVLSRVHDVYWNYRK